MTFRNSTIYIFIIVLLFVLTITPASESLSANMKEKELLGL